MADKMKLRKKMEKDPAVRNGVYAGGIAGGIAVLNALASKSDATGAQRLGGAIIGTLAAGAFFGGLGWGATKVFGGNGS